jgi:hypothetical protein
MGSRTTGTVISDANGNYSTTYTPRYSESGFYQVGSCAYGTYSNDVHESFDIPGMSRVSNDFITWQPYQYDTLMGTVEIRNRSRISIGNIQVNTISLPNGCSVSFTGVTNLGPLETGTLSYVVTGSQVTTGNNYEEATFQVTADNGLTMNMTCYYYCRQRRGTLDVYPPSIATTMKRYNQKVLSFQVTNNGNGETGPITIGLPNVEWMSLLGSSTLESLPVGDSCAFSIMLAPDENVNLVQYTGSIAVNCANGNGISIPYTIEATSDSTGVLIVDVTDDITYNGNGDHLAGANVYVKGYYSLDIVAQGVTDENGLFTVENVPEGWYKLTIQATSHSNYDEAIIYIEGGQTNHQNIYLQFQPWSYSWVVVPTEVEDEYEFELVAQVATNVPVPVVDIQCPSVIDTLAYGDTLHFNMSISNLGLIDAYDVQLTMPTEFVEYDFYSMVDFIDTIHAKTTVYVPCMVTRTQRNREENEDGCTYGTINLYHFYTCNARKEWVEHKRTIRINYNCHSHNPIFVITVPGGNNGSGSNGGNGQQGIVGPYGGWDLPQLPPLPSWWPHPFDSIAPVSGNDEVAVTSQDCTPCWKVLVSLIADYGAGDLLSSVFNCFLFETDIFDPVEVSTTPLSMLEKNTELVQCLESSATDLILGLVLNLSGLQILKSIYDVVTSFGEIVERLGQCISFTDPNRDVPDIGISMEQLQLSANYGTAIVNVLTNLFQEDEWMEEEHLEEFMTNFAAVVDSTNHTVSPQATQHLKDISNMSSVNDSLIQCFVDRWNRSIQYWNEGIFTTNDLPEGYDDDFIRLDSTIFQPVVEAREASEAYGFNSVSEMYESSYNDLTDAALEHKTDVCAKVSVSFKQHMTMTREAFEGTLKIFNGHTTDPMQDINVDIVIKDADGVDRTDLFQINVTSLSDITGVDGTGTLDAQTEGIAQFVMIPTIEAAPDTTKIYYFGGSFSFLDPFSGTEMTYELFPQQLKVNPGPNLHVDYFISRYIISDDPLTDSIIEPTEPAELAMMISNVGAGNANNVYLESSQPQIIENQNGLLINFDMVGAAMNGEPRPLGLTDIPFGTIESHSAGIAEWYFTSTLMARVIHSTPHVIHTSSYGNPDLSLVTELRSHDLIKAIRAYGPLEDGINDFFVNETVDFNHTPDKIYFSNGGTASVRKIINANTEGVLSDENNTILLNVAPIAVGWNYACVDDPGQGLYEIVSCTRDDGQEIPLSNVWLTFVTMLDEGAPIHENKLHIVDTLAVNQATTYTLVFAETLSNVRIFNGNVDVYWSHAENWEDNIMPQADDEVLINGICQLDEDVTVFSLTVAESQSLTIPADRILTVTGTMTSAAASRLIIEDGGQLVHGNAGAQATVRKGIAPYTTNHNGWYLIAPPLAGSTDMTTVANMLSNSYDLYYYDEPTHYWINQETAENNFNSLVNGKGYLYANNQAVELGFVGELQSGTTSVSVLLNSTEGIALQGFNLVGNPYAHNVTSYASMNVANGCYQMNEAMSDLIVSEISESNPLKPVEGFFVKATNADASVTFNPGRGTTASSSGSLRVEVVHEGKLLDRLIVKNEGEPLEKLSLNEDRTKIFAMQDHQEVAIVTCEGNEQPVNFKAAKNGNYTINVNFDGMEFNYLHLIDNMIGADVNLLAEPNYTFEAHTNDYASRFRLVFSLRENTDGDDENFAFFFNGKCIINNDGDAILQGVDVLGHVLSNDRIVGCCEKQINAAPGVYMLRLINGDNVRVQKVVVR